MYIFIYDVNTFEFEFKISEISVYEGRGVFTNLRK